MHPKAHYFQRLGIAPTSDKKAIKKAYRRKAFALHPDKNPSDLAQMEFIELTEAYEAVMGINQPPISPSDHVKSAEEIRAEKLKKARQQYQKIRAAEKDKDERYFISITTGKAWKIFKAMAIYSAVFSTILSFDYFLTRDYGAIEEVHPYPHLPNMVEYKGELFEIDDLTYWLSDWKPTRANYSFFFHDLKSVSILKNGMFFESDVPQDRTEKFQLFKNFPTEEIYSYSSIYFVFPYVHILLFLPLFLVYYKRPTFNFVIARILTLWVIFPIVLILTFSNGRIFHLFGLL